MAVCMSRERKVRTPATLHRKSGERKRSRYNGNSCRDPAGSRIVAGASSARAGLLLMLTDMVQVFASLASRWKRSMVTAQKQKSGVQSMEFEGVSGSICVRMSRAAWELSRLSLSGNGLRSPQPLLADSHELSTDIPFLLMPVSD